MGAGFKSRGAHENPVSSHESWVFFDIGKDMKKLLALTTGVALAISLGVAPSSAVVCAEGDTQSIRSLLVPITRLSAHQGRNVDEIEAVLIEITRITKATKSTKLKKSLKALEDVIRVGKLNPGSTDYWGYRQGSAWKSYKAALTVTQKIVVDLFENSPRRSLTRRPAPL